MGLCFKLYFVGVLALHPIIKSFAELFQKRRLAGGAVIGLCSKLLFSGVFAPFL